MTVTWLSHDCHMSSPQVNCDINIYMYPVTVPVCMTITWPCTDTVVQCWCSVSLCAHDHTHEHHVNIAWLSHGHHMNITWPCIDAVMLLHICVGTWNTVGQRREAPREMLDSARSLTRLKVLYIYLDSPKRWVTFILWPFTPLLKLLFEVPLN